MPNGMPVIESDTQYSDALEHVSQITSTPVGKFNQWIDLDQADKDTARQGAEIFDTMDAYRPDMAAGYFEAGLLYYIAGDSDTALNRLNQSLEDAPLPGNLKMEGDKLKVEAIVADCHHMISMILFDRHDYKTAADEASLAIQHMSTHPSSFVAAANYFVARARAEVQLNQNPAAKKDLAAALKLDPTNAMALRVSKFLSHG